MSSSRKYRNYHGQALAEGAAALILLTAIIVGGVLLILGTGTLAYYKIKLAAVTSAAAKVAVDGRYWLGAQRPDYNEATVKADVTSTVQDLLGRIGLPAASAVVNVDFATDPKAVIVKLTVSALPIISGGILPNIVTLQDTEAEPYITGRPIGWCAVRYNGPAIAGPPGSQAALYLPCYGANDPSLGPYASPEGNGHFPYWQDGGWATPLGGPFQDWSGGGRFAHY